jgi:hypothetical protein
VPALEAALRHRAVADGSAELEAVLRDIYGMIARTRRLLSLLERSAIDLPELSARYYKRGRRAFVGRLTDYLEQRMSQGHLRSVDDPATTARFVIEAISWFARHRHGDADSSMITDAAAEATCIDMLLHALLPAGTA